MWPMWCTKDLQCEFTSQEDAFILSLLNQHTAGGTLPPTNQTWLAIATAMTTYSNTRKFNHRSVYARYTLYLKPNITPESRQKALDAAGKEGNDAAASEDPLFPNLAQFSQLQQDSGNATGRHRLPPLQMRIEGLPPLVPAAERFGLFGERVVVGPPMSFEENLRERKAVGEEGEVGERGGKERAED